MEKYENKEIISKGVVIGTTHIDSPVTFQLQTQIIPLTDRALGQPPVIQSVISDAPLISMTFVVDKDKEFVFREIHKAVTVTGGLLPIRSYELTQFMYPVDQNPAIYAGVGSRLMTAWKEDKNNLTDFLAIYQNSDVDLFIKQLYSEDFSLEDYSEVFYRTYVPWYNFVHKEIFASEGNTAIMTIYLQPVDMFAYFKNGIASYIRDEKGVIMQEMISRYINIHGSHIFNKDAIQMAMSIDDLVNSVNADKLKENSRLNLYEGVENLNESHVYTPIKSRLSESNDDKKVKDELLSVKINTDHVSLYDVSKFPISMFASNSIIKNFEVSHLSYKAKLSPNIDDETKVLKKVNPYLFKDYDASEIFDARADVADVLYDTDLGTTPTDGVCYVSDGDTFKIDGSSFRVFAIDSFETPKDHYYHYNPDWIVKKGDDMPRILGHMRKLGYIYTKSLDSASSSINTLNDDFIKKDGYISQFFAYFFIAEISKVALKKLIDENHKGKQLVFSTEAETHGRKVGAVNMNGHYSTILDFAFTSTYINYNSLNTQDKNGFEIYKRHYKLIKEAFTSYSNLFEKNKGTDSEALYKIIVDYADLIKQPDFFPPPPSGSTKTTEEYLSTLPVNSASIIFVEKIIDILDKIRNYNIFMSVGSPYDKINDVNRNLYIDTKTSKPYAVYELAGDETSLLVTTIKKNIRIQCVNTFVRLNANEKYYLGDNVLLYSDTPMVEITGEESNAISTWLSMYDKKAKATLLSTYLRFGNDSIGIPPVPKDLGFISKYVLETGKDNMNTDTDMYRSTTSQFMSLSSTELFGYKENESIINKFFGEETTDPNSIIALIAELANEHVTLFPELSQPFKKLINSIDEEYFGDSFIYKYTHAKSAAYPLLYTNSSTFATKKKDARSDIALSYMSTNKLNVNFLEAVQSAIYHVLYETDSGWKGVMNEYNITSTSFLVNNQLFMPSKNFSRELARTGNVFRSFGNIVSDVMRVSVEPDSSKKNIMTSLSGTLVRDAFINKFNELWNFKAPTNTYLTTFPDLEDVKEIIFPAGSDQKITYKTLRDRMAQTLSGLISGVVSWIKAYRTHEGSSRLSPAELEYIRQLEEVSSKIDNIISAYAVSGNEIHKVSVGEKTVDLTTCNDPSMANDLLLSSQDYNSFAKLYSEIENLVNQILIIQPKYFLQKRLFINDSPNTSITGINHIYESGNVPVTQSQSSVGSYFQHIGTSTETANIIIRTSDFAMVRQLMLIYFSADLDSKNILQLEKARSSYVSFSTETDLDKLNKKIRSAFSDLTQPDQRGTNFDYSIKIDNDLLNSYGFKFCYIEDITVSAIENRVDLYNVKLTIKKTIPKERSGITSRAFNKSPFRTIVTETMLARYYEDIFEYAYPDNIKPNKFNKRSRDLQMRMQYIGTAMNLASLPVMAVSLFYYTALTDNTGTYSTLATYLNLSYNRDTFAAIYKHPDFKKFSDFSNLNADETFMWFTEAMLFSNASTVIESFSALYNISNDMRYSSNSVLDEMETPYLQEIKKQISSLLNLIYANMKSNLFSSIIKNPSSGSSQSIFTTFEEFQNSFFTTIEELVSFFANGSEEYITTMHSLALFRKYGSNKIIFKFSADKSKPATPGGESGFMNLKESKDCMDQYNKFWEIKNYLTHIEKLYLYDANNIVAQNIAASAKKLNTSFVQETRTSKDTTLYNLKYPQNIMDDSEYINIEIKSNGQIELKVFFTFQFIRIIHSFISLIRAHGYNHWEDIDGLLDIDPKTKTLLVDSKNDIYDSPLLKQLMEFYQTVDIENYYPKTKDSMTYSTVDFDVALNKVAKTNMRTDLKYVYKLAAKIMSIGNPNDSKINALSSFDLLSYSNHAPLDDRTKKFSVAHTLPEDTIFPDALMRSFASHASKHDHYELFSIPQMDSPSSDYGSEKKHTNSIVLYGKQGRKGYIARANDLTIFNTDGMIGLAYSFTKNMNVAVEEEGQRKSIAYKKSYSLADFMQNSLFGSSYNIVKSVTEEIYSSDITPITFNGKFISSDCIIPKDTFFWTAASLQFGTFGQNNPYAPGFFYEGNYAQTNLPTCYVNTKPIMIQMFKDVEYAPMKYILLSMLMGTKNNTDPAFYIYNQTELESLYTQLTTDVTNDASKMMDDFKNLHTSFKDILAQWRDQNLQNIRIAASNVRKLKHYLVNISQISDQYSSPQNVLNRLDTIVTDMISLDTTLYYDEKTLKNNVPQLIVNSLHSRQANNERVMASVQENYNAIMKTVIQTYNVRTNSSFMANLNKLIQETYGSLSTASKSIVLMNKIDSIDQNKLNETLSNFELQSDYILNEGAGDDVSMALWQVIRDIKQSGSNSQMIKMSTTSAIVSEIKDASYGTSQKITHLNVAYPMVKVLLMKNEIPEMLVFDELFLFSNIASVSVSSSVKSPAYIADIEIFDPFDDLHNVFDRALTTSRYQVSASQISPSGVESLNAFTLDVGTGVQVRMGFSRRLGEESIIFNGRVTNIGQTEQIGLKKITCSNYGSNLWTIYDLKDDNIYPDEVSSSDNSINEYDDDVDMTMAYRFMSKFFVHRPEAFSGLYKTRMYDSFYISPFERKLSNIMEKVENKYKFDDVFFQFKKTKIEEILILGGLVNKRKVNFLENFKPVRPNTETATSPADFVYKAGEPTWDMLKQIQLHYLNHYMLVRPMDNRETLVFATPDSVYKTTTTSDRSQYNIEMLASLFNPIGQEDVMISNLLVQMIQSNIQWDEAKQIYTANLGVGSADKLKKTYMIITLYALACMWNNIYTKYDPLIADRTLSLYNLKYDDYISIIDDLPDPKSSFNILMREMELNLIKIKDEYNKSRPGNAAMDFLGAFGRVAVLPLAIIAGMTPLSKSVVAVTGLGAVSAVGISASVQGKIQQNIYRANQFYRNISSSLLVLCKNYRKVSALHAISNKSILMNDIQLMRNANTVAMTYFNASDLFGGSIATTSDALSKTLSFGNADAETILRRLSNSFLQATTKMYDRHVSNLSDPNKWLTLEFPFHEYLPGDLRNSTFTVQRNALMIKQIGVNEEEIVAQSIMRHTINEYYGGQLLICGNNNIFSGDRILLNDSLNSMAGLFEAREVMHMFSATTGFVTAITPSLIVRSDESSYSRSNASIFSDTISMVALPLVMGYFMGSMNKMYNAKVTEVTNRVNTLTKSVQPANREAVKAVISIDDQKANIINSWPKIFPGGLSDPNNLKRLNNYTSTSGSLKTFEKLLKDNPTKYFEYASGSIQGSKAFGEIRTEFVDQVNTLKKFAETSTKTLNTALKQSTKSSVSEVAKQKTGIQALAGSSLKFLSKGSMAWFGIATKAFVLNMIRSNINGQIIFPIRTAIGGRQIQPHIVALQKNGETFIANLEGIKKASIIKESVGNNFNFRIQEAMRQVYGETADEYYREDILNK